MNKGIVFNAVLSIAVVVLFIMEFQNQTRSTVNEQSVEEIANNLPEGRVVEYSPGSMNVEGLNIAYVNIDSVNLNYVMLIDMEANFKQQTEREQKELQKQAEQMQKEYQMFVEQVQKGMINQQQAAQMDQDFKERQMRLMQQEQKAGAKLENQRFEGNKKVFGNVSEYLKNYAQSNGYDLVLAYGQASGVLYAKDEFDVTSEVINGLNDEYNVTKTK